MSNTNIDNAFTELDKLYFSEEILPVYELIKKNRNRISFVKDYHGLGNLVFMSSTPNFQNIYDFPYFSIFTQGDIEIEESSVSSISYSADEILENTKKFLLESDEPLYVSIGFEESFVTNDDYFEIYYLLEETKCNILDAVVSLRRFPDWYKDLAEYPFYIIKQKELINQMFSAEKIYLSKVKEDLLKKFNSAVSKNDEVEFDKLKNQLNNLRKQIEE